jgi:hypothetical protein
VAPAQRLMLLAAGVVVLLLVAGLVYRLRGSEPTAGPPGDAAVSGPPHDAQPPVAGRSRDGGPAVKRRPVARTQWPTDVPAGAAKPPLGGFDKWTGDEFYRPDELKEAARARGVGLELFRESKRSFWLTQLTLDWPVLTEMGLSTSREVRAELVKLSTRTHEEAERLLTAASRNEVGEAEARTRIRQLEDGYRKKFCEASGLSPDAFDRFFEPSLVVEP